VSPESPRPRLRPAARLTAGLLLALPLGPVAVAAPAPAAPPVADLQARLGRWWPRLSAVAGVGQLQEADTFSVPRGNGAIGLGPNFAAGGLRAANGQAVDGPFYVPTGGGGSLTTGTGQAGAGLEVDWALVDRRSARRGSGCGGPAVPTPPGCGSCSWR
jgi:hypothetical protein